MEEMALRGVTLKDILEQSTCKMCELGTDLRGVVYLAQGPVFSPYGDAVKIGFTRSIIDRIPGLSIRYEGDICMEHVIWTDDPRYLEARFHDLFNERHADTPTGREWFTLSDKQREWFAQFEAINCHLIRWYIEEPEALYEECLDA